MKNIESLLKVFLVVCTAQLCASGQQQDDQVNGLGDIQQSICLRFPHNAQEFAQIQSIQNYTVFTKNTIMQRIDAYIDTLLPGDDSQPFLQEGIIFRGNPTKRAFKTALRERVDATLIVPNLLGDLGCMDVDYQLCVSIRAALWEMSEGGRIPLLDADVAEDPVNQGANKFWMDLLQLAA